VETPLKKRTKIMSTVLVTIATLVSGCATTDEPLPSGFDYGPPPSDIEQAVEAYFQRTLKDPESARYEYETGLIKVSCIQNIFKASQKSAWDPYWAAVVRINARNSYGGYTGNKRYSALFVGDSVAMALDSEKFRQKFCRVME
jgi:hypothetical protein